MVYRGTLERVDVVVVGGSIGGITAALSAAKGGVRTILVEQSTLPKPSRILYALRKVELDHLGIKAAQAERVLYQVEVNDRGPASLGDDLAYYAVSAQSLQEDLVSRARAAGVLVRDGTPAARAEFDREGWRVTLYGAEPVRAPILIIADGARSKTLKAIGISEAQRYSAENAEIMTFAVARFNVGEKAANKFASFKIIESHGPLSRIEVLPGSDSLTVAFGPIWRGVATPPDATAPSHELQPILEVVRRKLSLSIPPESVEREEWRLDALPVPATFDGGIVIGAAAGHRKREALCATGQLARAGELAGEAAASAVLSKRWHASALREELGRAYLDVVEPTLSGVGYEARGLRKKRALAPEFWA